jgi:hypothetical protein
MARRLFRKTSCKFSLTHEFIGVMLTGNRTNNGVIHILDKVMSPLNASSTNGSPSATTSGGAASPTKTGAASGLFVNQVIVALVTLMSAVLLR